MNKKHISNMDKLEIKSKGIDYKDTIYFICEITHKKNALMWLSIHSKKDQTEIENWVNQYKDDAEFYCVAVDKDNEAASVKKNDCTLFPVEFEKTSYWRINAYDEDNDWCFITMFYNCRSEEEASWLWGKKVLDLLKENNIDVRTTYPEDEHYECSVWVKQENVDKVRELLK